MEEYLVDQLPSRALADVLTSSRIFTLPRRRDARACASC